MYLSCFTLSCGPLAFEALNLKNETTQRSREKNRPNPAPAGAYLSLVVFGELALALVLGETKTSPRRRSQLKTS